MDIGELGELSRERTRRLDEQCPNCDEVKSDSDVSSIRKKTTNDGGTGQNMNLNEDDDASHA